MDYFTDTSRIDTSKLESDVERSEAIAEERREREAAIEQQQAVQQQQEEEKEKEENKNNPLQEIGSAIAGGLADAGSDILTAPERIMDMASGEMAEKGVDYTPDWDPLKPDQFETQTWWGNLIRTTVNLGTLLLPVGGAFKALGMGARAVGVTTKVPGLVKGAAIGAGVDLVTAQSQGENLSQMIVQNAPWTETVLGPLATKDTDHPMMKTLKNVLEGMGIGAAVDALLMLKGLRKGNPEDIAKAVDEVDGRNKSVETQTIEKGREELKDEGFRGHKNKPIAEPQQGSPNSMGKPMDVQKQLDEIDTKWDAADGSTDSVVTPTQAERIKIGGGKDVEKVIKGLAKGILSDERYQSLIDQARTKKSSFKDIFKPSLDRAYQIVHGRNTEGLGAQRYWEEVFPEEFQASTGVRTFTDTDGVTKRLGDDFDIKYVRPEDVLAIDIAVGSLIKQLRDLASGSKEMLSFRDILDGDGPLKTIADRIVTGLAITRRTRYLTGLQLQQLAGPAAKKARKEVLENLDNMHKETVEAMDMVMGMIRKDDSQSFINAWVETVSKMKDVNNLTDLDSFMRKVRSGGEIKGKKQTGMIIKEMMTMMVNSILSGPKTPVRAFLGTAFNISLRSMAQVLGSGIRVLGTGDVATFKSSLASTTALLNTLPESFEVFKRNFTSTWSGDYTKLGNRFVEYERRSEDWARLERWTETRGNAGDRAAFRIAKIARDLNTNPFFTLNSNIMSAEDAAFDTIMSRARARELATREVLDMQKTVNINFFADKELMKSIEDRYMKQIVDEDGIKDDFLKKVASESKLNTKLDGFAGGLEQVFNKAPWAKPFFLFARTGINGVAMTAKYTPGLNLVLTKQRDILSATADNLDNVRRYGINTAEDLANEKAVLIGRQAMGSAVTLMAAQKYLAGELHGNGPEDRQLRKSWIDSGWQPRSIKMGDVWVSLDAFEPFNTYLYTIADIGDNMALMGPQWAEQSLLQTTAAAFTTGQFSKSYMQGVIQLADLFSGEPYQLERIAGGLLNNTVPLAGLRNEIGKLVEPNMQEVNNSIIESIRNRNRITEGLAADGGLPDKFDILNGEKLKDQDPITRFFNMISPIQFNMDDSPGRRLLFESNSDVIKGIMSYDSISFAKHPRVRSLFQKALGDQNLEKELNKLAARQDVKDSIRQMQEDFNKPGGRGIDPKDYKHNMLINKLFERAKAKAWATIKSQPEVVELLKEEKDFNTRQVQVRRDSSSIPDILSIPR